jgi:hypothetical protein
MAVPEIQQEQQIQATGNRSRLKAGATGNLFSFPIAHFAVISTTQIEKIRNIK